MRIGFWGNFGTDNFGNECTLHAMLGAARRLVPNAELVGVCSEPGDTHRRHQVPAIPIARERLASLAGLPGPLRTLRRPLAEALDCSRVLRELHRLDMLVMTGTGMIADRNESLLGFPYQMFKWVVLARLMRRKVKFVSVGAEEMSNPVHMFFLGWSLRLAHYRSYRDHKTQTRARRLLARASADPLFPDLAFSLPEPRVGRAGEPDSRPTVAVGLYAVEGGAQAIGDYVEVMGRFVLWLLERGYRTRLVLGDNRYDTAVRDELRAWLARHAALDRVVDEPMTSFEDLMAQLADADLVVATRFHNVLLALLLGKPVVSISHMDKNDELMAAMGLTAYCRTLEGVRLEEVVALFEAMERNADAVRAAIAGKLAQFRGQLEEQYRLVFAEGL